MSGRGWSTPIVWGDKVFFTSAILKVPPLQWEEREGEEGCSSTHLMLNISGRYAVWMADSGKGCWKRTTTEGIPTIPTHRDNTYASESPVTDGKMVYVYLGMTGLYAYDYDGNLVWEKDMEVYPTRGNWGTASSPVLWKNTLYLQNDNEENSLLVALDKETGEEKWRVQRDEKSNWSTPLIWKNKMRTELVTGGKTARSYDPATGALLWELNMGGGRDIASPVS